MTEGGSVSKICLSFFSVRVIVIIYHLSTSFFDCLEGQGAGKKKKKRKGKGGGR